MVDFSSIGYDTGAPVAGSLGAPAGGFGGDISSLDLTKKAATSAYTQPNQYNMFETVAGDVAFGVPDLVDTVASSIPLLSKAAGIQRGDFNNAVLNALDVPGLRDFYEQNQGGIHVASGIMGIVAADLATGGLAGAAPVVGVLSKASWARKALALDGEYKNAIKAVNIADETLASRGLTGSRLFTESMGDLGVPALTSAGLDSGLANVSRAGLLTKAAFLGAAKGAATAARVEAVSAVTLNQNDFLYSDSLSDNIKNAALGLGIGGLVGGSMAKYAIRKFANSDLVRRVTAGALDPTGLNATLTAAPTVPAKGSAFAKVVDGSYLGNLQGSRTDRVVALYTDARQATPAGVDPSTFARKSTQYEKMAQDEVQKVTTKGIAGVESTGFSTNAQGFGNHLNMLNHKDPAAMMGVEMAGSPTEGQGLTGLHQEFSDNLSGKLQETLDYVKSDEFKALDPDDKKRIAALAQLKQLQFMNRLVPTPVIDGEVTTMSNAAAFDNWVEPQIKKTTESTKAGPVHTFDAQDVGGNTRGVALDSNGQIYLPDQRTVNNASHQDMLNLFRVGGRFVQSLVGDPKAVMQVPENPNWFHLDMAEELLRKNPNATVNFPNGLTRETAQVESFAQKVDALSGMKPLPSGDDAARLRVRYNLPRLTAFENGMLGTSDTPMDVILRGAVQNGGGDAVRAMSLQDLQSGIDAQRQITDLSGKISSSADKTQGNMFNFLTDDQGQTTRPIMMYRRPFMEQDWTQNNLSERLAIKKVQNTKSLLSPSSGPMTRQITGLMASSPDAQLASSAASLNDTQIASSLVPLAGNQASSTPFGRFINGVVTAEWRARDNPVILAATRLREGVDRMSQGFMKNVFQSNLGDQLVTINGPKNTTSKFMLNNFHSFGQGWDLVEKPVETTLADGSKGYAFTLDDTAANRDRYRALYGKELSKGDMLADPQGKVIQLDDMAMNFQNSLNAITDTLRTEKNSLLDAANLPTISRKPFYIPPPNPEGKFVGFTFDPIGNVVPGGSIIANTEQDFNRIRASLLKDPNSIMNREGHTFRTQNEIKDYATLMDKAQMDMMSPGRTYIQGAKTNAGGLLSPQINLGALDDSLESIRNEFLQHGRDVLEFQYDDALKAAKARSAISTPEQAQGKAPFGIKDSGKNIYDYYSEAMTGRSPILSDKSVLGRIQASIEQVGNSTITAVGQSQPAQLAKMAGSKIWGVANDWLSNVVPWDTAPSQKEVFKQLVDKLGPNMPFNTVADMMESQGYGAKPTNLKSLAAGTSRFEATWILRMMEPMQAVMNLTGVLNAAPAVVRHVTQNDGESLADYAQRIGHSADIFTTPQGQGFGVLNMAKLMQRSFQRAWSGAADADWQRLADKGMLSQEVAEFQRAFNASETRSGLDKFMNGDPNAPSKFGKKGIVGWASWMTDASEDFSRAWSHMIGDDVAKQIGITDTAARDNFAHDLANKMIANYNPGNRPAIFQGVVGTPIGLFQGFIWAYYQRMFRYMETGDKVALATQYATQAASFGLKTVPGFQEVNSMYFKNSDGHSSPYDAIYNRFGASAGDMLMGGVWGNLPRLIGGKAVDLASRGDTSFRTPVLTPPAFFSTAQKIWSGVGQTIGLFGQNNPHMSRQQIAEILSNTIPNRPMANMIEQFAAGGNDTDASGQLVAKSHDMMDTVARVLGTRTMTQSNELEAFYSNKQAREIAAQQREQLNANTRALIRGGDPEKLQGVYQDYINQGGDPRTYKRWIKTTIQSAVNTRGERQLADLLHNPANQDMANRLLGQQTGIMAEQGQGDPAETMSVADSMEQDMPTNAPTDNAQLMYADPNTNFQSY